VAADAAREGEFLEELLHARQVLALVRVDLCVGALEVHGREHARRAVAGSGEEDRVQVVLVDQAIEVHVGEGQSRARAPVPEQTVLDVGRFQPFAKKGVVLQVDHADGEVVAGAPVGVDAPQFFGRQGLLTATRCGAGLGHSDLLALWIGSAVPHRARSGCRTYVAGRL